MPCIIRPEPGANSMRDGRCAGRRSTSYTADWLPQPPFTLAVSRRFLSTFAALGAVTAKLKPSTVPGVIHDAAMGFAAVHLLRRFRVGQ
jgi:hypothetical protein